MNIEKINIKKCIGSVEPPEITRQQLFALIGAQDRFCALYFIILLIAGDLSEICKKNLNMNLKNKHKNDFQRKYFSIFTQPWVYLSPHKIRLGFKL